MHRDPHHRLEFAFAAVRHMIIEGESNKHRYDVYSIVDMDDDLDALKERTAHPIILREEYYRLRPAMLQKYVYIDPILESIDPSWVD